MFGLIFGIIVLIVGIIGAVILKNYSTHVRVAVPITDADGTYKYDAYGNLKEKYEDKVVNPYKIHSKIVLFVSILICVLCIFLSCISTISTGHTGIITIFGKVEDKTLESGFNFKYPWESVIQMDNRVQKAEIELSCFSSDIQEVICKYTLNYQINKSNAQNLYKTVGKDYYGTAIFPTVAEGVKAVVAKYTAEQLIITRSELAESIELLLREQLTRYNIEVVSTAIEDLDFSDSFTNAVESKSVAAQNKLKAEIEQAQAVKQSEADAQVAKTQAEASAEVSITKAKADAEIATIQANADMEVQKIGADAAAYAGQREGSVILQRLASINGWSVVLDENLGINRLYKPDGTLVSNDELLLGVDKLLKYNYNDSWDGNLPDTYVGTDNPSSIILNSK